MKNKKWMMEDINVNIVNVDFLEIELKNMKKFVETLLICNPQ